MLKTPRVRRTLGGVAVAAVAALACVAPTFAQQQGHFDPGQPSQDSGSSTTASGLVTQISTELLLGEADGGHDMTSRVEMEQRSGWVWSPALQDPSTLAKTGLVGAGHLGGWSYPAAWEHDQRWHPVQEVTLTFSHPVQDPTVDLLPALTQLVRDDGHGTAVVNQQVRLTGASSPDGADVPVDLTVNEGPWGQVRSGTYRVLDDPATGDPTLTPGLVDGAIPYYNPPQALCGNGPQNGDFKGKTDLLARYPDIDLASGPCVGLRVDTGGTAVSSVTYVLDQTYASAQAVNADYTHLSFTGMSFAPVFHQELSGHATPESLGRAAHTMGDLRIGEEITSARDDVVIDDVPVATEADNSEDGYVAEDALVREPLRAHDTGEYTVTVPVSGASTTAYLNGWIDFDGDGSWSEGEAATAVEVAAGAESATLTFQLPTTLHAQPDGVTARFRIAYDEADVAQPTGLAASGEVEDHLFVIAPLDPTGGLTVDKSVSSITRPDGTTADVAQVGDEVSYSIVVTDNSPYAVKDVVVADEMLGEGMVCTYESGEPAASPVSLGAGEHITCTGTYVVTDADVASGNVHNVATATGAWDDPDVTPGDVPPASDETNTETEDPSDDPVDPTGGLTVDKSVSSITRPGGATDDVAHAGDTIAYSIVVTDDSDYAMADVVVDDAMLGDGMVCAHESGEPATAPVSLGAGEQLTCAGTYVVTDADVAAGNVHNIATATATWDDPNVTPGDVPPASDETDTDTGVDPVDPTGGLTVDKSVSSITRPDGTTSDKAHAGDTIAYSIVVTDGSDYAMTDVVVDDPMLGDGMTCEQESGEPATSPVSLGAGEHVTCTGTYVVTDADVTNGTVHNVATATAGWDDPDVTPGEVPSASDETNTDTDGPVDPTGGLAVEKGVTAITRPDGTKADVAHAGDRISYSIVATDDSPYAMADVVVSDPLLGDGMVCTDESGEPAVAPVHLGAGGSVTCTGDYTVTAADVENGSVHNVATASASWDDPDVTPGDVPPASDETDTDTDGPGDPTGGLAVEKSVTAITRPDGTTVDVAHAGDTISYSIVTTDDSPYAMSDVVVSDPLLGDGMTCVFESGEPAVGPVRLEAGESVTCTGDYSVTDEDVATGAVHNVATATGSWDDPDVTPGDVPPASDEVDTHTDNPSGGPSQDPTDDPTGSLPGTDGKGPGNGGKPGSLAITGAGLAEVAILGLGSVAVGATLLIRRRLLAGR